MTTIGRVLIALDGLGHWETETAVRILEEHCKRLRIGQAQYGLFDPATDRRDWSEELKAEVTDAAVYIQFESLAREIRPDGR